MSRSYSASGIDGSFEDVVAVVVAVDFVAQLRGALRSAGSAIAQASPAARAWTGASSDWRRRAMRCDGQLFAVLVGDRAIEPLGQRARRAHQFVEGFALGQRTRQHREQVEAREALRIHDGWIEGAGLRQRRGADDHAAAAVRQVIDVERSMPETGARECLAQRAPGEARFARAAPRAA